MLKRVVIAFEGPKGCGKSTALERVVSALRARGVDLALYRPTRPMPAWHPVERLAPWLERWDPFVERLYAARGCYAWARVRHHRGLVLGDRSVLTSYVTRWDGSTDHGRRASVARVHRLQPDVRPPDHVLLFQAPLDVLLERTSRRHRTYGRRDECPDRLKAAVGAYEDLMHGGASLGLSPVRWHPVDAARSVDDVSDSALACVSSIIAQELP